MCSCSLKLPFNVALALFCVVNLLNYMDRGIVAGEFELINKFIEETLPSATPANVDSFRGLLSSSFILSYALSSVLFGHLVHFVPKFKLMAVGLLVWCVAVLVCAIAPDYTVLVIGRALSGVGEASFQCVVPPYIDDKSTKASRARNLALFFAMIPCGTAVGYGWAAAIGTTLGWRWSFGLEAPVMLPLALVVFFLRYDVGPETDEAVEHEPAESKPSLWSELYIIFSSPIYVLAVFGYAAYTFAVAGLGAFGPQFVHDLGLVSSLADASLVFGGLIAFTGFAGTALGGFVLDNMQHRDDVAQRKRIGMTASGETVFSAIAADCASVDGRLSPPTSSSVHPAGLSSLEIDGRQPLDDSDSLPAGALSPVAVAAGAGRRTGKGGAWGASDGNGDGDKGSDDGDEEEEEQEADDAATKLRTLDVKLCASLRQVSAVTFVGMLVSLVGAAVVPWGIVAFSSVLGLGTIFLFAATAGTNIAIMAAVPARTRPLAIGVGTVITHAFGDVPSPVLIGLVSDALAPDYGGGRPRSQKGLQTTLVLVQLWLLWAVLLWGAAWCLSRRRRHVNELARVYEEVGGPDVSPWRLCGPSDDQSTESDFDAPPAVTTGGSNGAKAPLLL